jgi:cobalamin synthase
MTRLFRRGRSIAALAAAMFAEVTAPAFAATSEIGKNVGAEVKSWATTLLLAVAALVALPVLAKRDVNGGLVLALLVVVLGGFAFAPDAVKHTIDSIWQSIAS